LYSSNMYGDEIYLCNKAVWEYSASLQPIDTNRRGVNINKALKLIGCINFDIYSLLGRKNILE
ncbi:hypothetical protein, partial [Acinetobacter baumannii]